MIKIIKNIYNFIPSKKIKRRLFNKLIFSNKLSNIFLNERKFETSFTAERKKSFNNVSRINYIDKPFVIMLDVNNKISLNVYKLLNNISLPFDVYVYSDLELREDLSKIKKILYCNNVYYYNKNNNFAFLDFLANNSFSRYEYTFFISDNDEYYFESLDNVLIKISSHINLINDTFGLFCDSKVNLVTFDFRKQKHFKQDNCINKQIVEILTKNYFDYSSMLFNEKFRYSGNVFMVRNSNLNNIDNLNYDITNLQGQLLLWYMLANNDNAVCYCADVHNFKFNLSIDYNSYDFNNYYKRIYDIVLDYDIISFDIFDTLITRKIYKPDNIFDIMSINIKDKYNLDCNFVDIRKEAEKTAVQKYNTDVNLDQIYCCMNDLIDLDCNDIDDIKSMEIELEKQFLIPRLDMLKFFNYVKKIKKIILVSDMYLDSNILSDILANCGYKDYCDLIVSCEVGLRKDSGLLWKYVKDKYCGKKILHFGDNILSDHINALENDIMSIGIHSPNDICRKYLNFTPKKLTDCILYGELINYNIFNNVFNQNYVPPKTLEEYGELVLGPIFLKYFSWLLNQVRNSNDVLLFVSRDGYYLKKIFDILKEKYEFLKEKEYYYFLISRRAISIPTMEKIEDFYKLLDIDYLGSLKQLLLLRFGVDIDVDDREVVLPKDKDFVKSILDDNKLLIINNAKQEKKEYINYIKNVIHNYHTKKLCIVDLGYSGTAQFYLSKLINKKVSGKYFIVSDNVLPLNIGCKVDSCFKKNAANSQLYYDVLNRTLLLEMFLTAPYGQLLKFKDNVPIYTIENIDDNFKNHEAIFSGIIKFLDNYDLLNFDYSSDFCFYLYNLFFDNLGKCNKQLLDSFKLYDFYCSNDIIDIIKKYEIK